MRHELQPAPRTLVVEQDAGAGEQVVALAVVDGNPVAVDLSDAVGAARVEGGLLGLRHFLDLAKHLRRASLVEAYLRVHHADGVEDARHAQRRHLAREDGLRPGGGHETLCCQVVDLGGAVLAQNRHQRHLVHQVAGDELHPLLDVADAVEVDGAGAAHHPDDVVALVQQELGQIRAVLAGDAGDKSALALRHGGIPSSVYSVFRISYSVFRIPYFVFLDTEYEIRTTHYESRTT